MHSSTHGARPAAQDSSAVLVKHTPGMWQQHLLEGREGTPPTLAVFSGSSGSRGGGAREVLTAQKRHPRVQVSPMSMIVAVAVCPSPPPQHSLPFKGL